MREMKKGQVSAFVMLGLMLIIISGLAIYKINEERQKRIIDSAEGEDITPVKRYIESCLSETAVEGMMLLGKQGLITPEAYLASKDVKVAYFYFKGKNYMPGIEMIEEQLAQYVEENMDSCIYGFSDKQYEIEENGKPDATAFFTLNSLEMNINYPLLVNSDKDSQHLENFNAKIETRFLDIFTLAGEIVSDIVLDPEWIVFDRLSETEFDARIIKVDKSTLIYVIKDNKLGLNRQPYEYRFGVKYGT